MSPLIFHLVLPVTVLMIFAIFAGYSAFRSLNLSVPTKPGDARDAISSPHSVTLHWAQVF